MFKDNIVSAARIESQKMGHSYVGTEQLLLGLLIVHPDILGAMVELPKARTELEKIIGRGDGLPTERFPTAPRAREGIFLAEGYAQLFGAAEVGAGHLLLGIIDAGGQAITLMRELGFEPSDVKRRVLEKLDASIDF